MSCWLDVMAHRSLARESPGAFPCAGVACSRGIALWKDGRFLVQDVLLMKWSSLTNHSVSLCQNNFRKVHLR